MSKNTVEIIKSPYVRSHWSLDQQAELATCMDPVDGYLYFMDNFFYIQHPVKGKIQYHPWDYQKRLIHNYHNYRFSISLMPRQTGKSTSAAGYLLWYAMFVPDSTILIAAHKYLGAQEIMQRIRFAYEACPNHIRAGATANVEMAMPINATATTVTNTDRTLKKFNIVRPQGPQTY